MVGAIFNRNIQIEWPNVLGIHPISTFNETFKSSDQMFWEFTQQVHFNDVRAEM
jgi:hypothetical protein